MGDWTADNVIKMLTLLVALVGGISGVIASIRANQAKNLGEINSAHLIQQDVVADVIKRGVNGQTQAIIEGVKEHSEKLATVVAENTVLNTASALAESKSIAAEQLLVTQDEARELRAEIIRLRDDLQKARASVIQGQFDVPKPQ